MTYKPKLIEVALPLAAINEAAYHEQTVKRGKPTQMHKWWAGRPLVTARAVIWASLVDDPSGDSSMSPEEQDAERQRLFRILEQLSVWENSSNPHVLAEARAEILRCYPDGAPAFLDPFGGGGAIPLEAQRLGLKSISGDLNPVAVLIQKAMLEIPSRFANRPPVHPKSEGRLSSWSGFEGLASDIEAYGSWMRHEAEKRIGDLYPMVESDTGETLTPIAWIWARTIESPDPTWKQHVPLVTTWWLSKKSNTWIEPEVDRSSKSVRFHVRTGGEPTHPPTISRAVGTCVATGAAISADYIKAEGQAGRLGTVLLAIVAKAPGRSGRVFVQVNNPEIHQSVIERPDWFPSGAMSDHSQYMGPPKYGIDEWHKLFNARQLNALKTFFDLLREVRERVINDAGLSGFASDDRRLKDGGAGASAYADAITTYLAFAINRLADWNNTSCGWDSTNNVNQQLFRRQAVPMMWDHCEIRPFDNAAGSFGASLETIATAVRALPQIDIQPGSALQIDCRAHVQAQSRAAISTDPPYYDAVPYSDISDFFYVLCKASLSDVWPDLLSTIVTPKKDELVADYRRLGSKAAAAEHFESGMSEFMLEVATHHNPTVPSTIYYAYKATEGSTRQDDSTGWSTFLQSIIDAGLLITSTWPLRTENPSRMRAIGANALSASIVLACRPRDTSAPITTRAEFVAALRTELPPAVRLLQSGNIAPVDLPQSTIGPGIRIFSRYSRVFESDGSLMRVSVALGLINEVLSEVLDGEESEMDPESRFALTWYSQFGYNPASSGDADNVARAKNTSTAGVVASGLGEARAGKFRLFERADLDPGWTPVGDDRLTVWESTQYLIAALERSESEAASLLRQLGGFAERARTLAYLLFKKATDKGWAAEAGSYNGLITAWPTLQSIQVDSNSSPAQQQMDLE